MVRNILGIICAALVCVATPAFGQASVVAQQKAALGYTSNLSPDQLHTLLSAVAAQVHGGLLVKPDGNNCGGYACDVICFSDAELYDVLGDSDGAATPTWNRTDNPRGYRCALVSGGPVLPPPPPPSVDIPGLLARVAALEDRLASLEHRTDALETVTRNAVSDAQVKAFIADAFAHVVVSGSTGRAWGHSHTINVTLIPKQ